MTLQATTAAYQQDNAGSCSSLLPSRIPYTGLPSRIPTTTTDARRVDDEACCFQNLKRTKKQKGSSKETRELDEVYNKKRWSEESVLQVYCSQLVLLISCIVTPSFTVCRLVVLGLFCILIFPISEIFAPLLSAVLNLDKPETSRGNS
jgi:hypothetical protein